MSSLKNSPFGKRLRAAQHDIDDDEPKRTKPRVNPIFGLAPASLSSHSLESRATSSDGGAATDSSVERRIKDYGDRFVPSRDTGDIRTSYNLLDESGPSTPSKSRMIPSESDALKEQANNIFTTILHNEVAPSSPKRASSPTRPAAPISSAPPTTPKRKRLFMYNSPSAPNSSTTPGRRLDVPTDEAYALSPVRAESRQFLESPRRKLRQVCKTPYRVLDAPELADDFYLNLVDWSSTNVLAVGLGSSVYLWKAETATVSKLCDVSEHHDTISSVSWVQKGSQLAIGTISGKLHIYDGAKLAHLRTYQQAHVQRIGSLAWNSHILTSGSRDRNIYHRDVREATTRPFKRCAGHRQEVCGLKWSGDGGGSGGGAQNVYLASGGNDNKVCIWDLRGSKRASSLASSPSRSVLASDDGIPGDVPLWKFHEHSAAVKALAWDPHQANTLATGGGTQDKHIRFWNIGTGSMINKLDTGSQVCNLIWSLTSHELVSTHGFSSTTAQNQICIWKYPSLNMVASLSGHSHRVLYLAMSPDGETIVTGAGDETLRFWTAFERREEQETRHDSKLDYGRLLR